MSTVESPRVLIDSSASKLAFDAGQELERLLVDAAVGEARRAMATVVTSDHIRACLNAAFIERACTSIVGEHDGESGRHRKSA